MMARKEVKKKPKKKIVEPEVQAVVEVEETPETPVVVIKEEKKPVKKTKAGPKSHLEKEPPKVKTGPVGEPKLPHGKKYRALVAKVDPVRLHPLEEAIALVKETSPTKFDATVELHAHLNQEARSHISWPHATGKKIRVATVTPELIEQVGKGKIDFDVLIAKPEQMAELAKLARVLGPKGLMPNPKSGTVTENVEKVKAELEAGRIEYRSDEGKNVHLVVGKVSQPPADLLENINTALTSLQTFGIRSVTLATTMGPGVKLEPGEVRVKNG